MSKFSYKTTDETNVTNVLLDGPINETFASFDFKSVRDKGIRFDFQKVSTINSMGIRYWIAWIQKNSDGPFYFRNCPVCIVDQINNVSDFMPKGTTVESFYVPYYSEHTGEEKHELYVLKKDYQLGQTAKVKDMKDSQGNKMEIDVYPQKYFKFLLKN